MSIFDINKSYDFGDFLPNILKLGINPTQSQLNSIISFFELLVNENKSFNLTSIVEWEPFLLRHILDSACLNLVFSENDYKVNLLDIGSGAGIPGIPIKIFNPDFKVQMMDATKKKIGFIDKVISKLGLTDTYSHHGRAEELGHHSEFRGQFDYVTARAVAELPTLLELMLPFVNQGGYAIAMKGETVNQEIQKSTKALHELGGKIINIIDPSEFIQNYPGFLVVIEKISETPTRYPRRNGVPMKSPLI
tara:strand:+ start:1268 stop:2014 length:747 start_codon:yes stop_codon:yes gene_type:complete